MPKLQQAKGVNFFWDKVRRRRWDKLHACTDHSVFRPLVFRPNSPGALAVFSCSQATITRIPTFHNAPFSGRGRANAINSHYRPTLDAGANHNWLRRHTGVWVCVSVHLTRSALSGCADQTSAARLLHRVSHHWLQQRRENDTIRDAILTCTRKPTWVGLTYCTEPTIKKCKNRKIKK